MKSPLKWFILGLLSVNHIAFAALPTEIDNSKKPAFPAPFYQNGNSCSQASAIGYALTYELNASRGQDALSPDRRMAYSFTYNFISGDGNAGSSSHTGFDIAKKLGVASQTYVGGDPDTLGLTGWANGYGIYEHAMKNRISNYYSIDVGSIDGINKLRQWMYDHGRNDTQGGVAVFQAWFTNLSMTNISSGPHTGESLVLRWGNDGGHAMTFVGYNDSIHAIDLNGDGNYTNHIDVNNDGSIDLRDYELGALKLVNSWGTTWGDAGFAWYPYSSIARLSDADKTGGIGANEVWVADPIAKNNPKRAFKITLSSDQRNSFKLTAGVAESNTATIPTAVIDYGHAFKNAGTALPMQGYNVNSGSNKSSTLEFGLDLSALDAMVSGSTRRYFLIIEGSATLNSLSLMDYTSEVVREITSSYSNIVTNSNLKQTYFYIDASVTPEREYSLNLNSTHGQILSSKGTSIDSGVITSLTAVPERGYLFKGWTGDLSGTSNPIPIQMNGTKNVSAQFEIDSSAVLINQNLITISSVSSEDTKNNGLASNLLDGNSSTNWLSTSSSNYPYEITLDLHSSYKLSGIEYTPMQNSDDGKIKAYAIYVSSDGIDWGNPVSSGTLLWGNSTKLIRFKSINARYIKWVSLSSQTNVNYAGIAELNVTKDIRNTDVTTANQPIVAKSAENSILIHGMSSKGFGFKLPRTDEYEIVLYDQSGKKILHKIEDLEAGEQFISLDDIATGNYFLTIHGAGQQNISKFYKN